MVKCQPYKYNKLPCKCVRHVNLGCFTETGSRKFVSIQCRLPWQAHRAVLATILHLTSRWRRAIKSFGNFWQCFREPSPHLWTEHFSMCHVIDFKRTLDSLYTGLPRSLQNSLKSWNWQKPKIPGPGKSLNLGYGPWKSWNGQIFDLQLQKIIKMSSICDNQTWYLRCNNVWKQKRRHEFSPEANLANLIAELMYRTIKLFWYKRPLNLLKKVPGCPWKVLEFQIQLTVATLYTFF